VVRWRWKKGKSIFANKTLWRFSKNLEVPEETLEVQEVVYFLLEIGLITNTWWTVYSYTSKFLKDPRSALEILLCRPFYPLKPLTFVYSSISNAPSLLLICTVLPPPRSHFVCCCLRHITSAVHILVNSVR